MTETNKRTEPNPLTENLLLKIPASLPRGMKPGIVSRVYGVYYNILPLPDLGPEIRGRLRGKLRLKKEEKGAIPQRHPIFAGDLVLYKEEGTAAEGEMPEGVIHQLLERSNAVYRSSPFELHGLGANLDRALLVMSLTDPQARFGFLDRFLSSCHAGGVAPLVLFTKPDLLDKEDQNLKEELLYRIDLYRSLGYAVHVANLTDSHDNPELEELRLIMAEGITLLTGQSGTGKSTLLNRILGHPVQRIGSISESTGKGKHTTTNSTLFLHRDGEAMLIDTPGVKEWGISHMSRPEIIASFPELSPRIGHCRFRNCDHSEGVDGCAIQEVIRRSLELFEEEIEEEADGEDAEDKTDEVDEKDEENRETDTETVEEEDDLMDPERIKSLFSMIDSLKHPDRIRTGDYIKPTGRMRKEKGL